MPRLFLKYKLLCMFYYFRNKFRSKDSLRGYPINKEEERWANAVSANKAANKRAGR